MKEEKEILALVERLARQEERIRALILSGSRSQTALLRDDMMNYNFYVGTDHLLDLLQDKTWWEQLGEMAMIYHPDRARSIREEKADSYRVVLVRQDKIILEFTFLPLASLSTLYQQTSLIRVMVDKDERILDRKESNDVMFRMRKPSNRDFQELCLEFFYRTTFVAKGLYRNQMIYAMRQYHGVLEMLDRMVSYHVGANYNFAINLGESQRDVKTFMMPEDWDQLNELVPINDRAQMWSVLLNTAMFFRRMGLQVAAKLNFEYPKEMDRSMMRYLRETYSLFAES